VIGQSKWFGSTSINMDLAHVNNWQRLSPLPFKVYVKIRNFLKQKRILSLASKRKTSVRKNSK
jgi:hypothetical protein